MLWTCWFITTSHMVPVVNLFGFEPAVRVIKHQTVFSCICYEYLRRFYQKNNTVRDINLPWEIITWWPKVLHSPRCHTLHTNSKLWSGCTWILSAGNAISTLQQTFPSLKLRKSLRYPGCQRSSRSPAAGNVRVSSADLPSPLNFVAPNEKKTSGTRVSLRQIIPRNA